MIFHITDEGEQLRQGFNFYPRSNKGSRGFKLRIGDWAWMLRYSTKHKKWSSHTVKFDRAAYNKWLGGGV